MDRDAMTITKLPSPPCYSKGIALCVIRDRFLLLTGGYYQSLDRSKKVLLFDTHTEQWVSEPSMPEMITARSYHSNCATDYAAFVYGGESNSATNSSCLEFMALDDHVYDYWSGNYRPT